MIVRNKLILAGCLILNGYGELLLLCRHDSGHYETPGGKIEANETKNPDKPAIAELKIAALRELHEELGQGFICTEPEYFGKVDFKTRDGRDAIAHKFVTKIISGEPSINEPEIFSGMRWIKISELEKNVLSPDLILLLPKIRKLFM